MVNTYLICRMDQNLSDYQNESREILDQIYGAIEGGNISLLASLSDIEFNLIVSAATQLIVTQDHADPKKITEILIQLSRHNCISFRQKWHCYCTLLKALQDNKSFFPYESKIRGFYDDIFCEFKRLVLEGWATPKLSNKSNNVVVITPQLINLSHSPTRCVLEYIYLMSLKLGVSITLIISGALDYEKSSYTLAFEFNKGSLNAGELKYRGQTFQVKRFEPSYIDELNTAVSILEEISYLDPILVFSWGGGDLIADFCSEFIPTIAVAFSYDMPHTNARFVGSLANHSQSGCSFKLKTHQELVHLNGILSFHPTPQAYSREQFNIPPNDFVISIVGNRLEHDIDDDFLKSLEEILFGNRNLSVVIIGRVDPGSKLKERLERYKNLYFLGPVVNSCNIVALTDIYLNPYRKGGGTSVYDALHCGVPVITPSFGDGFRTAGVEFCIERLQDIPKLISRYMEDPDFYSIQKVRAQARSLKVSLKSKDIRTLFSKVTNRND